MTRARTLFALLVPAAVFAAACSSGNSLFATGGGETGGSNGTSTTGTGGASSTSSSGTTTSSSGTTTSSTGSTTTSSSTSSSTSASSTTSSGAPSGACTDAADAAKLAALGANLQTDVTNCAKNNLGQEPATKNCIATMTGLSAACVTCFDTNVQCADQKCLSQCIVNSSSAGCVMCIHTNCTPAFNACSGLMGL